MMSRLWLTGAIISFVWACGGSQSTSLQYRALGRNPDFECADAGTCSDANDNQSHQGSPDAGDSNKEEAEETAAEQDKSCIVEVTADVGSAKPSNPALERDVSLGVRLSAGPTFGYGLLRWYLPLEATATKVNQSNTGFWLGEFGASPRLLFNFGKGVFLGPLGMVAATYRSDVTLSETTYPSRIGYSMGAGLVASYWHKSSTSNERDRALGATLKLQDLVAEYQSQCLNSGDKPEGKNNCEYLETRIKRTVEQIGHKQACLPPRDLKKDKLSVGQLLGLQDYADCKKHALDDVATTVFTLGTRYVYTDVENVKLGRVALTLGVGF